MTVFIVVCVAMVVAALFWIVLPLVLTKPEQAAQNKERRLSGAAVALLIPVLAVVMYSGLSNWDWKGTQQQLDENASVEQMLTQLERKLVENPKNLEGWLMLGRSYTAMGRYPRAVDAFQQAYDLTQGQNVEALIGLGEALTLTDEASLTGRAGKLFDTALTMAPNNPKALWYASMSALRSGDLRKGRDRLQLLMAQNPPEELRGVLERQIQDLNEQIGEGGAPAGPTAAVPPMAMANGGSEAAAAPAAAHRSIQVEVKIAPALQQQLGAGALPLFILARDPNAGGPPLAVQRHSSKDLPLKIELSERDAMIPTRSIATVPRVVVVARVSRSGAPQAGSGDLYGEAEYEFGKTSGALTIIIDRTVP